MEISTRPGHLFEGEFSRGSSVQRGQEIINQRMVQVTIRQNDQEENLSSLVEQLNEMQKTLKSLQAEVREAEQKNNQRAMRILNQLAPKNP